MPRKSLLQVLLLSMFVLLTAWARGQSSPGAVPYSGNADSSSTAPTEQQEMRNELKALRAEVERLRAEVEQSKGTTPVQARVEPAPMAVGAGPSVPSVTAANFARPSVTAMPVKPSEVVSSSDSAPAKKTKIDPFSDWDWTWLNGNPRTKEAAFDSKFFTPEIRADINYVYDFNKPKDNSMGGSSEMFRSNEIQLEQLGVGGDFHFDNVRARLMTQFGMYSTTTPRNDPSPAKGQWDLSDRLPLRFGSLRRLPH